MSCTPPRQRLRVLAAAFVALLAAAPAAADLDVVFVLDTTGSMGGEIREVQDRVRELAESLAGARAGERIRYGIVAYRDRGDLYVTKVFDLTDDVAAAASFLDSLEAGGGGDGPESVVAAIATALWEISWNRDHDVDRLIFLIGDAPPHLDYGDEPTPDDLVREARRSRIVINTIGCRSLPHHGIEFFRSIAYATEGSYQHIGRVAAADSGTVTEAVERSLTGAIDRATSGREIEATWMDHREGSSPGILVRQGGPHGVGQSREAAALDPCVLEVRLPPGLALVGPPRVWLVGDRLRVELVLTDGPGGIDLYALERCPPRTAPVDVIVGGG